MDTDNGIGAAGAALPQETDPDQQEQERMILSIVRV